jgi:phosphatidylinositol phospholipase C, delta|eukprot:7376921-Prymnesium_polylepis.2
MRQIEIDCWDGLAKPIVTHKGTFCTVTTFSACAKAVAECAFVASILPLVISLEMHCNQQQQHFIADTMANVLGDQLLTVRAVAAQRRRP